MHPGPGMVYERSRGGTEADSLSQEAENGSGLMRIDQTTALLVIDVQNDFCEGGALAVPGGSSIVPLINRLLAKFRIVACTQDWHPATHHSFAASHDDADPYDIITLDYGPQVLWPTHCVMGTNGAEFHKHLEVDRAQVIIRKGFRATVDSYSAFFENDRTTPTGLGGYLAQQGIEGVVCVGLATDYCVHYSAMDARQLGFRVCVLEDACRAIDLDGSLATALQAMQQSDVMICQSEALVFADSP